MVPVTDIQVFRTVTKADAYSMFAVQYSIADIAKFYIFAQKTSVYEGEYGNIAFSGLHFS